MAELNEDLGLTPELLAQVERERPMVEDILRQVGAARVESENK